VFWASSGWDDYLFWQETDRKMLRRINLMIKDISRTPFDGLGKPEPLKHQKTGYWSRRIDKEHRLVYKVSGDADKETIYIVQCRYHYDT